MFFLGLASSLSWIGYWLWMYIGFELFLFFFGLCVMAIGISTSEDQS